MSKGPLTTMSNSQVNKGMSSYQHPSRYFDFKTASFVDPQGKSGLAELKNGKVIFRQRPYSFEKHSETLQELVRFREVVQKRVENAQAPLDSIEDEHKPLIAKLVHESDKTLVALAKHIHSQLLPTRDDEDDDDAATASKEAGIVPVSVIEGAILAVADRNNYGLELDSGSKPPASVCVWRWEIKELYRSWLPKNTQDKVANRLAERIKAKEELASLFASLPETEQDAILHIKASSRSSAKDEKAKSALSIDSSEVKTQESQDPAKQKAEGEENETPDKGKSKAGRSKKDVEKVAKAKKEKDAQKMLMANFFTKPKHGSKTSSNKERQSAVAGPSTDRSEFEKTFKPFVLKKDAQLAPINAFLERRSKTARLASGTKHDIIIIEDEDRALRRSTPTYQADLSQLSSQQRLDQVLSSMPPPVGGPSRCPPRSTIHKLKTQCPVSVRTLFKQLSEAEVVGDTALVRSIHSDLANRTLLPAKLLIFWEDARPGYYGTWTKSSRIVGARTPFAKDVIEMDYAYDSGEEWEEDPTGDADDVMEDADDDDGDTEDRDSDMDDWLVDDDEVEAVPVDQRADSPSFPILPPLVPKRKAADTEKNISKKRKVVIPLVPYAKGPHWEDTIGCCNENVFNPYQIRLLNDTPFAIDPFTFVSTAEEKQLAKGHSPVFAVPALPGHCTPSALKPSTNPANTPSSSTLTPAPKKTPVVPKTTFPDDHLPTLLAKVKTLQAANLTVLVEAIFQELRDHKVKKNAIEAKIKEVGEKCKDRKFWVVKGDALAGLPNGTVS